MTDDDTPKWVLMAHYIATMAHSDQLDKAGAPYLAHPEAVAQMVAHRGYEYEAAALLHDVVEDSPFTLHYLRGRQIPAQVVEAVDALTHRKDESRSDYYARVAANPIALVVKQADIAHNMSPERLDALDAETGKRLRKKYLAALHVLTPQNDSTERAGVVASSTTATRHSGRSQTTQEEA